MPLQLATRVEMPVPLVLAFHFGGLLILFLTERYGQTADQARSSENARAVRFRPI